MSSQTAEQSRELSRPLLDELRALVGVEHVTVDAVECAYFAQDVFTQAAPAAVLPGATTTAAGSAWVNTSWAK